MLGYISKVILCLYVNKLQPKYDRSLQHSWNVLGAAATILWIQIKLPITKKKKKVHNQNTSNHATWYIKYIANLLLKNQQKYVRQLQEAWKKVN